MLALLTVRGCHVSVLRAVVTGVPEVDELGTVTGATIISRHVEPLLTYLRGRLETAGAGRLTAAELAVLAAAGCLHAIGERDPAVRPHAAIVDELNAMAARQVDEPDFDRRLVVYGQVNERLRHAERLEDDLLRLVVHNCLWSVEHESDLALRDSSTFCLQEVARTVGRLFTAGPSAAASFLSSCLLPALRLRLRSRSDELRHETVAVLQVAVLACGPHVPKLAELAQLGDPADAERDFFENIRHIQVHRRTRALKRVVEGLADGSLVIRADVITNYVLPLANVYLFNDKYAKYTALTDAAVRLIGLVACRMSWHQYQTFLRHYLALLPTCPRQRDAVKVLVAVLDAFHFDLSLVTPDVTMSIISAARSDQRGWRTHLHAGLVRRARGDEQHALNRTLQPDEERAQRLPLALAMIKLLQKLPPGILEANVARILGVVRADYDRRLGW
ncbi:small subunit processome component 20 homolog [Pollicipes pollicipes]|uniref:small subunit processome component 20 homolog n=1 Tax=Pollicipes pollicipes TaxID=41117 RepID=UPI0018859297|nr:small subunit processome component 20 homolog [Pollicipes pollicipes]